MNLLIIGGTRFVGLHLVEEALRRGHSVTLFNRGKNRDVFPNVAWIEGDRNQDVSILKDKSFDAVIDTCGYIPRHLQMTADVLRNVPLYVFISTISVYADPLPVHADETAPLARPEKPTEEVTNETYGALKVLCENVVMQSFAKSLVVRPGFIVGPYDYTDRFSYWVWRTTKGGEMLAPPLDAPIQFVDARDLARWTLQATEEHLTGIFNVTSAPDTLTFGKVLETTRALTGAETRFTEVDESFLQTHEIALPLFAGKVDENWERVSVHKAVKAGLSFRTLEETIRDTLEYLTTRSDDYQWKAGLTPEKEKDVLEAWKQPR